MKITRKKKAVASSINTAGIPANPSFDSKEEAIYCIKSAIELLSNHPDDTVCRDSIANLSVVMLDLTPGNEIESCNCSEKCTNCCERTDDEDCDK